MEISDHSRTFEVLFRSNFKELARFVYGYVNDGEVAKDIVHDVFLVIWKNRGKLNDSYSMRPYLFTLCRNSALDYLKHLRVVSMNERELSEVFQEMADDKEVDVYEKRLVRIKEQLVDLPEKQREVLLKCFVEGKKYKEAADEMSISVNSVKTHISRGLQCLRERLREDVIMFLFYFKRK